VENEAGREREPIVRKTGKQEPNYDNAVCARGRGKYHVASADAWVNFDRKPRPESNDYGDSVGKERIRRSGLEQSPGEEGADPPRQEHGDNERPRKLYAFSSQERPTPTLCCDMLLGH
jgi:hypothetical protein